MLRPDLYPSENGEPVAVALDPVDEARAQLYLLFANLLLRVPDERILIDLRQLGGDDSALGEALRALAAAADVTRAEEIAKEHFTLFIGVGRGELLPFASYYQTGFLYERPLVRVRSDMRRLGLERGEEFQEPEDHLGFLMETMSGLITRRIPCEAREEKAYFERHLKPWVERFFADLEKMDQQPFYRAVGRLGSSSWPSSARLSRLLAKKHRMPPEADRNRGEKIAMTSDTKKGRTGRMNPAAHSCAPALSGPRPPRSVQVPS